MLMKTNIDKKSRLTEFVGKKGLTAAEEAVESKASFGEFGNYLRMIQYAFKTLDNIITV